MVEYGKETLKNLSAELTREYGKGLFLNNLEKMCIYCMAISEGNEYLYLVLGYV